MIGLMTLAEAVHARKSRRSYTRTSIDPWKISSLQRLMQECEAQSGLSFSLVLDNPVAFQGVFQHYGLFLNVQNYIVLSGNTKDIHRQEKAGYYGQKLVLRATRLGLGTCWVGTTYSQSACSPHAPECNEIICVIVIGNAASQLAQKERLIYRFLHRSSKTIESMCSGDAAFPTWFINAMTFVQKAPSSMNRQPVHFDYSRGIVSAKVPKPKGFTLIDLGIAKLHFELGAGFGRWEWGNKGRFLTDGSA